MPYSEVNLSNQPQVTQLGHLERSTPSAPVETHQKIPDSSIVKGQQEGAKPSRIIEKGKNWIQENKADLLIGSGKALMLAGGVGALVTAPLTISGGILGAVAAKIAKETGVMKGNEHKLSHAGLVVGSLGLYGVFLLGREVKDKGQDVKPPKSNPLNSTQTSAKTESKASSEKVSAEPKMEMPKSKETEKLQALQGTKDEGQMKMELKELNSKKQVLLEEMDAKQHELSQAESGVKSWQTTVDSSNESVKIDQSIIRVTVEKNKDTPGFSRLYEDYLNTLPGKKEQFITDLGRSGNLLHGAINDIHKSSQSIETFSPQIAREQAILEKAKIKVADAKEEISKLQGKLDEVEAQVKVLSTDIAEIHAIKEDLKLQAQVDNLLNSYEMVPLSDQIKVLQEHINQQNKYQVITHSDSRLKFIEKIKEKKLELEAKIPKEEVKLETAGKVEPQSANKLSKEAKLEQDANNLVGAMLTFPSNYSLKDELQEINTLIAKYENPANNRRPELNAKIVEKLNIKAQELNEKIATLQNEQGELGDILASIPRNVPKAPIEEVVSSKVETTNLKPTAKEEPINLEAFYKEIDGIFDKLNDLSKT